MSHLAGGGSATLKTRSPLPDVPYQSTTDLGDVVASDGGGLLRISPATGLENGAMFLLRLRHITQAGDIGIEVMMRSAPQNLLEFTQMLATGSGIQSRMEAMIQIDGDQHVVEMTVQFVEDRGHFVESFFREAWDGKTRRHFFNQRPGIVNILQIFGAERTDPRAAMGIDRDQSVRFEIAEGFADGHGANLETRGEVFLAQILPGAQIPADDLIAQRLDKLVFDSAIQQGEASTI